MKTLAFLVSFLLSLVSLDARSQTVTAQFDFLCRDLLQAQPALTDYEAKFTPEFIKAVSKADLLSAFATIQVKSGSCVSMKVESGSTTRFVAILSGDKTKDVYLDIVLESPSMKIAGLGISGVVDESIPVATWSDLAPAFRTIDANGRFGAVLVTPSSSHQLGLAENEVFAMGSTFKLYVLAALDRAVATGSASWKENLPINDDWKSLPSGVMQDWPAGKDVDLATYAAFMIAISDNTATDHLIHRLGRESVEAMFTPMGNSHAQLPLFGTLEMFKLKWAVEPAMADRYVLADETERRSILESLKTVPRTQVGTNGVSDQIPTRISTIEWFATPKEMCSAMLWLAQGSAEVREILGKNTPFVKPGGHWKYIGYKGGSEPGVVSMTYLLESQAGTRACLSLSWNNENQTVSEYEFFSIVKKVLKLAEKQVP